MFAVVCVCVLSGSDELITCSEESYRLWHIIVCDQENLVDEEVIARAGLQSQKKKAELFIADERTDGQTEKTKLTVTFRNFANAPKK
jgi:hypothetical protein